MTMNADGARARGTLELNLLGGFNLRRGGEALALSLGEQRLVGFLAVHNRPLQRAFVAGNLWIDSDEGHASGNLRSTVWRLRNLDERLIEPSRSSLGLSPHVTVDLHQATAHARMLLRGGESDVARDDPGWLGDDLLPDWYEDWVLVERERFRQLRLHALEALCAAYEAAGAHGLAVEAGLVCVAAEPLRESAHRALMRVHVAEGNPAEAVRQYRLYHRLVTTELGLEPSREMQELVATLPIGDAAVTRVH